MVIKLIIPKTVTALFFSLFIMFQLGELPEGEKNSLLEQLDTAERVAMEERLESSYRQIREYQDTLYQSQEQMDGARAFIESSEVSLLFTTRVHTHVSEWWI